jgi:hypothetical protein
MQSIHHKPIKMFQISGTIASDSDLWRLKHEFIRVLYVEMRALGYVPRLDINTDFTTSYNYEKNYFEFKLSMYGIYLGKKKSQWIAGVDETRIIYTQKSKSSECSLALEPQ